MGRIVGTIGVEVPDDFPTARYEQVNERFALVREARMPLWNQFASAWNGVCHRFLAAAEADDYLTASLTASDSPEPDTRAEQEKALFAFASAACSAIECLAYAGYAICAVARPGPFAIDSDKDRRRVSLHRAWRVVRREFPGDHLEVFLGDVSRDPERAELADWRNVLSHRGTPSRHFARSAHDAPVESAVWRMGVHVGGADVEIGPELSRKKRGWLAATVETGVSELADFQDRHWP